MSYIFSANGNAYTFKKLDSMLVNIPTDCDSNGSVLVRKTVDNIPEYSWVRGETYVIKTNKAFVKSFTPESNITISRGNSFKTSYTDIPAGKYLVTTKLTTYNEHIDELAAMANDINDLINEDNFIFVFLDRQTLINTCVLDTLNPLQIFESVVVIKVTESDSRNLIIDTSLNLTLLAKVKSLEIVFEEIPSS